MKMTIKEGIKMIALINEKIELLLESEAVDSMVLYQAGELPNKGVYDFKRTQEQLNVHQKMITSIKCAINYANATVKTDYNNLTIGAALIELAQSNQNLSRFKRLSNGQQISRITTFNGVIEYSEKLFDINDMKLRAVKEKEKIHLLQNAIDKANILTEIEV